MPLLGARSVTLTRYAAGSRGSDGRYTPGAATATTVQATVQPADGRSGGDLLAHLDAGQRARVARKVYSESEIRTGSQHAGTIADRMTIDGVVFEVGAVGRQEAILPHYRALLLRLQESE